MLWVCFPCQLRVLFSKLFGHCDKSLVSLLLLVGFLQTDHWKWRCSEAIKSNFGLVGAYLQIHSSLSYILSLKLEFVRSMSAVRRFLNAWRCCCRDTGRQIKKSQSPATPTCLKKKKKHVCSTKCTCILAECSSTEKVGLFHMKYDCNITEVIVI